MKLAVPDYIASIDPYVPGKPIEELEREYGIPGSVKLASNENPLGPSPLAVQAVQDALKNLHRYPDGSAFYLTDKLSAHLGVPKEQIIIGNGSDDIIAMLARVFLQPGDEVIIPSPSFLMYAITVQCTGAAGITIPLKELNLDLDAMAEAVTDRTRMIFICNPNNPTGTVVSQDAFDTFLKKIPENIVVVVDEAYIEFVRDAECLQSIRYADSGRPVVTLRTFSKVYGLAGLRVGYGITSTEIAGLLNRVRQPFNANLPAQAAACAALDDSDFLEKTLKTTHDGLAYLYEELERMRLEYVPTQANFFLIHVKRDAKALFEAMLREGVIIRAMTSYGLPDYIRVNAGTPEENQRFIAALEKVLGS